MSTHTRLYVAAATTTLALAPLGTAPATAAAADHGTRIVATRYSDDNGGHPQIVAITPQGGTVDVLTTGHQDSAPGLSPDGQRIVFQRCVDAFDCDSAGRVNVWVMDADGGHPHPLTACDGSRCLGAFTPSFSPDGQLITFTEDLLDQDGVNFNGVFVMRADGSHLRRLTSNGPDNLPDARPRFSPDGRSIAFQRETTDGDRLMTVRVDGTGLRLVLPGVDAFAPTWSLQGRGIAFTLARHPASTTTFDIATVRPDGSGLRILTNNSDGTASLFPAYSPDGSRLVYTKSTAGGCVLVVARSDGAFPQTLTTGPGCFVDADWGRDPRER